jgi:hypothetical protein
MAAAIVHQFVFRDQIMQRMLPEKSMVVRNGEPEARGRSDETRPAVADRPMIRIAKP